VPALDVTSAEHQSLHPVVGVEAGAADTHLHQPGPHPLGWRVDGDCPRALQARGRRAVVARERLAGLHAGRAPLQHPWTPQQVGDELGREGASCKPVQLPTADCEHLSSPAGPDPELSYSRGTPARPGRRSPFYSAAGRGLRAGKDNSPRTAQGPEEPPIHSCPWTNREGRSCRSTNSMRPDCGGSC
jgi:hypothetical protein